MGAENNASSRGGSFRELMPFRACGAEDLSVLAPECLVHVAQDRPMCIETLGVLPPNVCVANGAPPAHVPPWLQGAPSDGHGAPPLFLGTQPSQPICVVGGTSAALGRIQEDDDE